MSTDEPGRVIGSGRDTIVYDVGGGRVLRRYRPRDGRERDPQDLVMEAEAMRWVRQHGVAAPVVFDVDGADIVMERVQGRSLLDGLTMKPHRLPAAGRVLGDLHRQLDAVPAPDWLECRYPADPGGRLGVVHGDLHPDNVILSPSGPVLIDWTNASAGDRGADLAQTWIILEHLGRPEGWLMRALQQVARRVLLGAFLSGVDRRHAESWLKRIATSRLGDPNTNDVERRRLLSVINAR